MPVWDTTVVSRLYAGGPLEQYVLERAQLGDPVAISAPSVMEAIRGLQAKANTSARAKRTLAWFTSLTASHLIDVLPLDRHAAVVAGRLRAIDPIPPTGVRRKATKPEQQAGWVMDIQIAACAWTRGEELASENVRDFEHIRESIASLYPHSSALGIVEPPA